VDDVLARVVAALFSQCGIVTGVLSLVIAFLVWWIRGMQEAYRLLERARESDRAAAMAAAESRARTFDALAAALNEMKGSMNQFGALLTAYVTRKAS
jgi:Na+-transporting methylmalonyl-CoA/oxaloacetate decarboxylase gamma subunit